MGLDALLGEMLRLKLVFDGMVGVNQEITTARGGILYEVEAVLQRVLSRGRKFGSRMIQ